jgi:hypothetical protein
MNMNWTAGLVAMVLLWVPCIAIAIWMHRANAKIDQEHKERMEEIRKRFGVDV